MTTPKLALTRSDEIIQPADGEEFLDTHFLRCSIDIESAQNLRFLGCHFEYCTVPFEGVEVPFIDYIKRNSLVVPLN